MSDLQCRNKVFIQTLKKKETVKNMTYKSRSYFQAVSILQKRALPLLCTSKAARILLEKELRSFTPVSIEAQKIASTRVYQDIPYHLLLFSLLEQLSMGLFICFTICPEYLSPTTSCQLFLIHMDRCSSCSFLILRDVKTVGLFPVRWGRRDI